jgi:hypothetical protein
LSGYYLMHRGWMDHPVFAKEAFTECQAFEWLISEAAWAEERTIAINHQPVRLMRGQVSHSLRFMAEAWGWDYSRARRFLKKLEKWEMVATQNATGQNIISLCNYDQYQNPKSESETGLHSEAQQPRNSRATNIKKDNTSKEIYTPAFEDAWKAYPESADMPKRNMSKTDAWKKWKAADRPEADLIRAVKSYAADLSKPNAPMPCHMATWLYQKRYEGPLAATEGQASDELALAVFAESLEPLPRAICDAVTPAVFRAWLNDAKIRDGPEITIEFTSAFRKEHFEQRFADKAERVIGKKLICRTGT